MQGFELSSVLLPCQVFITLLVLVLCYQEQWGNVPLEAVFPLHVLYQVWTHRGRFPGQWWLRELVESWLYVFVEFMLVRGLVGVELPSSWVWLQAIYVALALMPIGKGVERGEIRGLVFIGEGIYKSCLLVDSVKVVILAAKGFNQPSALLSALVGLALLLTAPILDMLEQALKQTRVDSDRLLRYMRTAPAIVGVLIGVLYWDWPKDLVAAQEQGFTRAHLLGSIGFVAWYGYHAVDYVVWEREQQRKRR